MTPLCPHCRTRACAHRSNRQLGYAATCLDPACVSAARSEAGRAAHRGVSGGGALVSDPAILDRPPGRLAVLLGQLGERERRFVAW